MTPPCTYPSPVAFTPQPRPSQLVPCVVSSPHTSTQECALLVPRTLCALSPTRMPPCSVHGPGLTAHITDRYVCSPAVTLFLRWRARQLLPRTICAVRYCTHAPSFRARPRRAHLESFLDKLRGCSNSSLLESVPPSSTPFVCCPTEHMPPILCKAILTCSECSFVLVFLSGVRATFFRALCARHRRPNISRFRISTRSLCSPVAAHVFLPEVRATSFHVLCERPRRIRYNPFRVQPRCRIRVRPWSGRHLLLHTSCPHMPPPFFARRRSVYLGTFRVPPRCCTRLLP